MDGEDREMSRDELITKIKEIKYDIDDLKEKKGKELIENLQDEIGEYEYDIRDLKSQITELEEKNAYLETTTQQVEAMEDLIRDYKIATEKTTQDSLYSAEEIQGFYSTREDLVEQIVAKLSEALSDIGLTI